MPLDITYDYDPKTAIPSLEGKVILITGANTGIGKEVATELAQHSPAHIYMTSRSEEKGKAAVAEVQAKASPGTKVSLIILNLASFASIKAAAREFAASSERLDILDLNAGILGVPEGLTEEGYEIQMGTNHIGHALLLKLLVPTLEKTASSTGTKPRIISVSSSGYTHLDPPVIYLDALKTLDGRRESIHRYTQSKLANILYPRQFAVHYPNLMILSIHPGETLTNLFKTPPGDEFVKHLKENMAPQVGIPINEAVKNSLWAATVADDKIVNGEYYEPVGEAGKATDAGKDNDMAKKLWDWTQKELTGHEM